MIGKILDERYELIKKIGSGGMADVYMAKDILSAMKHSPQANSRIRISSASMMSAVMAISTISSWSTWKGRP